MRRTALCQYLGVLRKISQTPISGYEIAELPNERVFKDFLSVHNDKLVMAIIHSGFPRIADDSVTSSFVSTLNGHNFGEPALVRFALVPGPHAVKLMDEHGIVALPTTLMYYQGAAFEKVVGARARELSIKALFKLRNEGKNIFSRT